MSTTTSIRNSSSMRLTRKIRSMRRVASVEPDAVQLDGAGDPGRLGCQEADADGERGREHGQREDQPGATERPVALVDEQESEHDQHQRGGREHGLAHELGVAREAGQPLRAGVGHRAGGVDLGDGGAAHPHDRGQDVHGQVELVGGDEFDRRMVDLTDGSMPGAGWGALGVGKLQPWLAAVGGDLRAAIAASAASR